jgi:hypothetical protein
MSKSMIARVIAFIQNLCNEKFTGKIEINFFEGGIRSINKFEKIDFPEE